MPRDRTRSPFGRVFRRRDRDGYYVRVRYKGKEVVRYAGPDRRVAGQYLAQMLRTLTREDLLGEKVVAPITFADFRPILVQSLQARHAASTYAVERGRLNRVATWFGPVPLKDIGPGEIQDFLANLRNEEGFSIAGANRYAALLSISFKLAVQKGYARRNPVKDVARAKEPQRPVPFVSGEDVGRLIAESRDARFGALVRVLADTGLRRSEALALEGRDVDLRRHCLVVRESKNRRPRQVELTGATLEAFQMLADQRPATPIKGPDMVWPEWTGKRAQAVSSRFRTISKRVGGQYLRLHDLRHGFCSRLAQAGVPLATIAALAGHSSWLTTQRYACHLPTGATRGAIQALERNEINETERRETAG
jgi:integrase